MDVIIPQKVYSEDLKDCEDYYANLLKLDLNEEIRGSELILSASVSELHFRFNVRVKCVQFQNSQISGRLGIKNLNNRQICRFALYFVSLISADRDVRIKNRLS